MQTQSDQNLRTVSLSNLHAMCERISGVCHRYTVTQVSRSRCHVEYSNPDEYGSECPVTAVLPVIPGHGFDPVDDRENPRIILEPIRFIDASEVYDPWQSFIPLWDCPTLWRDPRDDKWYSHREIVERDDTRAERADGSDACVVCDLPKGN
jgi:hypothetical protein